MDLFYRYQRRCEFCESEVSYFFHKIRNMRTHDGFYLSMFFDSEFSDGYFFLSSVVLVFCSRNDTSIYHTINHASYITFCSMMITPKFCHSGNTSPTSHELFENTELMKSYITFCKEYFLYKHVYGMTRFHERLKEEHDVLF